MATNYLGGGIKPPVIEDRGLIPVISDSGEVLYDPTNYYYDDGTPIDVEEDPNDVSYYVDEEAE